MKRLYLIGGAMGVGKTAVGQALKAQLPNSVFLDGDWCWDAHPFQVTEETRAMVMRNICFLLGQFLRCSVYENIVFCWVMHEQSIIDAILAGIDGASCEVTAVSLVCGPDTLRARLEKDIAGGLRTGDVIDRSLARLPLYDSLDTQKIDTDGRDIDSIARQIASRP